MPIKSYVKKNVPIKDRRSTEGGYYIAECDYCGTEYYPKKAIAKYCSSECMRRAWHEKRKKEIEAGINKPKRVKQNVSEPLKVEGSAKRISMYFKRWRLKRYVYEFLRNMEIDEEYCPIYSEDEGTLKYQILLDYNVKKLSQNKYELHKLK